MKLIPCPLNGPRALSEFQHGGEVIDMPPPQGEGTEWKAAWHDYLFTHTNTAGVIHEWWCHLPSAYWFIAERDTRTDEILRTYPPEERYRQKRAL